MKLIRDANPKGDATMGMSQTTIRIQRADKAMKVTIEYKDNLGEWQVIVIQNGRVVCNAFYTTFAGCINRALQY